MPEATRGDRRGVKSTRLVRCAAPHALAILVYGSRARGTHTTSSDLDLLVLVKSTTDRRQILQECVETRDDPVAILTLDELFVEARTKPSFVSHILDEGEVLSTSVFWDSIRPKLQEVVTDPGALDREIALRVRDLQPFRNTSRFAASPVTFLSHLWGVSRSLVIASLLREGVREYDWRKAFDKYIELHPERRDEVRTLEALRPYYEIARARRSAPRMLKTTLDSSEAQYLVDAVSHLADG